MKIFQFLVAILVLFLNGCQTVSNKHSDTVFLLKGNEKPLCASPKTKLKIIWNDDPNELKNIEEVKRLNLDCCSVINNSEKVFGENLGILQYGSTALLLATPLAPLASIGGGIIGGIAENIIPNKRSKYSKMQKNYILCKKAIKFK